MPTNTHAPGHTHNTFAPPCTRLRRIEDRQRASVALRAKAEAAHTPTNDVTRAVFHAPMFALNADADRNACDLNHTRCTPTECARTFGADTRARVMKHTRTHTHSRTQTHCCTRTKVHAYLRIHVYVYLDAYEWPHRIEHRPSASAPHLTPTAERRRLPSACSTRLRCSKNRCSR